MSTESVRPARRFPMPTWLLVGLVVLALLFAGSVFVVRAFFYYGPDPAPRDYLAEHRTLSLQFAGLDRAPEQNGWTHLQDALAALAAAAASTELLGDADDLPSRISSGEAVTDAELEAFRRFVASADEGGLSRALEQLAQSGGALGPQVTDFESPAAMQARGDLRSLTRLLAARAADAINRDSPEEALPPLRHLLALSRAAASELTLIDYLTAIAVLQLGLDKLSSALARLEFTPDHLALLRHDLAAAAPPPMHEVLRGEKLLSLDLISGVTVNGFAPKAASTGYQSAQIDRVFEELIAYARLSPAERRAPDAPRPSAGTALAPNLAQLVVPPIDNALDAESVALASLAAARLNTAICAHRAEHGALPASLADLVPAYFDQLPTDPRDPAAIVYTRVNDPSAHAGREYLLYAVGFDGIDNHGAHVPSDQLRDVYLAPGDPDYDFVFNPPPSARDSDN